MYGILLHITAYLWDIVELPVGYCWLFVLWDIVGCLWKSVGYIEILLTICETLLGVTGYVRDVAGH